MKCRLRWYAHHNDTGFKVGEDLVFSTRKAARKFIVEHLDPTNEKWKGQGAEMENVYRTAREHA